MPDFQTIYFKIHSGIHLNYYLLDTQNLIKKIVKTLCKIDENRTMLVGIVRFSNVYSLLLSKARNLYLPKDN
jgi:hypothetical protein